MLLPTLQDGVENRDKVYCYHMDPPVYQLVLSWYQMQLIE